MCGQPCGRRDVLLKARVTTPSSLEDISTESHFLSVWSSPPFLLGVKEFFLNLLPSLAIFPVIIFYIWTLSNKMTGLTIFIVSPLIAGLVVLFLLGPLDLPKAFNDEGHFLIKLELIDWYFFA